MLLRCHLAFANLFYNLGNLVHIQILTSEICFLWPQPIQYSATGRPRYAITCLIMLNLGPSQHLEARIRYELAASNAWFGTFADLRNTW